MIKRLRYGMLILCLLTMGALTARAATFGPRQTPRMDEAVKALQGAMDQLSVTAETPEFMVLTNAGYGCADKSTSEGFLDVVTRITGRTPGTRTLLLNHTPCTEPLWFSLYNAKTHDLAFIRLGGDGFDRQLLNIAPEKIFQPDNWAAAAKGLLGSRTFSVVSTTLSWAAGADWTMLRAAELHDHFCPGLNAGFIAKAYVDKNLPLGPGDSYAFIGAAPMCAMDALQSAYGATVGKKGTFSMMVPAAAKKHASDGITPCIIALRVNKKKDVCDGVALGFDWAKAAGPTGVTAADRSPKGGKSNPLFYISRAKMSWKLVQIPMDQKLGYIKAVKTFNGPASLAARIENAGADPYAPMVN